MDINQIRQNKASYIIKDLKELYPYIDEYKVYNILLNRGIFKWLRVRRDLIRLKDEWKKQLNKLYKMPNTQYKKGFVKALEQCRKALEQCRKEVRNLCHMPRLVVQDNDKKAMNYFRKIIKEKK